MSFKYGIMLQAIIVVKLACPLFDKSRVLKQNFNFKPSAKRRRGLPKVPKSWNENYTNYSFSVYGGLQQKEEWKHTQPMIKD